VGGWLGVAASEERPTPETGKGSRLRGLEATRRSGAERTTRPPCREGGAGREAMSPRKEYRFPNRSRMITKERGEACSSSARHSSAPTERRASTRAATKSLMATSPMASARIPTRGLAACLRGSQNSSWACKQPQMLYGRYESAKEAEGRSLQHNVDHRETPVPSHEVYHRDSHAETLS
jgi:hypothetical protein